jgi:hypothetical protein
VGQPRSKEAMARNRRVEFRLIRVLLEPETAKDFDY